MENRRFFVSFLLFTAVWMLVAPRLFPSLFPQPPKKPAAPVVAPAVVAEKAAAEAEAPPAAPEQIAKHPHRTVVLGPQPGDANPDPAFYLRVTTTSRGAAIETAEFLNPLYTTLDRKSPLKIVGNTHPLKQAGDPLRQTLQTSMPTIDSQLKGINQTLADVEWEVVPGSESTTGVTYRYHAPDGSIEVRKKYELKKGDPRQPETDVNGYLLLVDVTIENLKQEAIKTKYRMMGPTGLPLDDPENARTFIELKAGTLADVADREAVTPVSLTAATVISQYQKAAQQQDPKLVTVWRQPARYAGTDVQYFAALVVPKPSADAPQDAYFAEAKPVVLHENAEKTEQSDVALEFTSREFDIPAGQSRSQSFEMFLGPKRSALLTSVGALPLVNAGSWWWIREISNILLGVLNFFHHTLHAPYWLAIIMLTVCVRGLMFPVSLRQTAGAQKMKEIQPELAELKKKYSNEPEKFALAQRDVFRKHNYNPLSGCLPLFLQMPIFIGLYNALYYAIDLRLARFLWVDNLAAPDALFKMPFEVPFTHWTYFNLLPFIVVALFLTQQKLFMPPPTNDETRMQGRMMNIMTVFMGLMFYRSPAGLCIYFIASSTWGICERKILDRMKPWIEKRSADKKKNAPPPKESKGKGWLDKMLEMADEAKKQTGNGQASGGSKGDRDKRRNGKVSSFQGLVEFLFGRNGRASGA
jgi:YidC/Oxa1 family membrane protein insertase